MELIKPFPRYNPNQLWMYLVALLLIGTGYLSILPPFERFDETAHFSRIRETLHTGTLPQANTSFIDRSIVEYSGPSHYGNGLPPFNLGNVYPTFFANPSNIERFALQYKNNPFNSTFEKSTVANWQAQHPPLYYALLSPLLGVIQNLSLVSQLFVIRLVSFILALIGVGLAVLAAQRNSLLSDSKITLQLGFVFYPLLAPMFFFEFARVGNDSLCLLIAGALAYVLSFWFEDETSIKKSLGIGVILGLGILTKAFFLPISIGLGCFLLLRIIQNQNSDTPAWTRLRSLFFVFAPALLLGGLWYLFNFLSSNSMGLGGDEAAQVAQQGGLLAGLKQHFSFSGLVRGLSIPFATYGWVGSWSLARISVWLQLPLLLIEFIVFSLYLFNLRQKPFGDQNYLLLWLAGFIYLGLGWHVLISMSLSGIGTSPGWYFHILLPWIAPAFGLGLWSLAKCRHAKLLFIAGSAYLLLFQLWGIWGFSALYSGCAIKGDDKYIHFPNAYLCLDQWSFITDRLSAIANPSLGIVCFSAGLVVYLTVLLNTASSAFSHLESAKKSRQFL